MIGNLLTGGIGLEGLDMKELGKRQRKNRSRARVARARADVKRLRVEHDQGGHSAAIAGESSHASGEWVGFGAYEGKSLAVDWEAIAGVAFHPSDGEPCACWGDDTDWKVSTFTRE